ncbi:ExbD/TolR family protein [Pontiella sp.]|uniref:ExbD/TolR family protein n=1 Tax=Pontiella sp. TaxID=2837462 RepID=UPI0035682D49
MDLTEDLEEVKLELQIAPLIDVVFLLLIYFMVAASLIKKEGDISFILPATVNQTEKVKIPLEVLIEIDEDGTVLFEGLTFSADDEQLKDLAGQVAALKQVAKSQQSPFFVNILPNKFAFHERVINVMDACAAAGVDSLTFSKSF